MKTLRFIAYGDIHHDRKAARCLTMQDTLGIEQQVHQRVAEGKFDFSVFVGDRYLKREPEDEIKVTADRALAYFLSLRPEAPHYHLVGNHDWTRNNRSWHTSESLRSIPNLFVLDKPGTPLFPGRQNDDYIIHALPADAPFDDKVYQPTHGKPFFNLLLFHGIVKGSLMSDTSARVFDNGIDIAQLDRSWWDFVIGGDIHVPQKIPFTNTSGGYTGSVLQRTRADADKPRGWIEVTAVWDDTKWTVTTEFRATRNFFHREIWQVGPETQYPEIKINETYITDQAVEVKLVGNRKDVDRVADDSRWKNYKDIMLARSVDIIREYKVENETAIVDFSTSRGVLDDLTLYMQSGFANVGGLSPDRISAMVTKLREVQNG